MRDKLLPKALYATFESEQQACAYAAQLEELLAQGIVPASASDWTNPSREIWTVSRCIAEYVRANAVLVSEIKLLDTIRPKLASLSTGYLNYEWAERQIQSMKRVDNLVPGIIRHRQRACCFDWMLRKHPNIMVQNPLCQLKRRFQQYTPEDERKLVATGRAAKVDDERNRRLDSTENARIDERLAAHSKIGGSSHWHSRPPCACTSAIRSNFRRST